MGERLNHFLNIALIHFQFVCIVHVIFIFTSSNVQRSLYTEAVAHTFCVDVNGVLIWIFQCDVM